jgi:hypothetical protein
MNYWQDLVVDTARRNSHRCCQNFSIKKLDRAIFISLFSNNNVNYAFELSIHMFAFIIIVGPGLSAIVLSGWLTRLHGPPL